MANFSISAMVDALPSWVGLGAGGGAGFYAIKWIVEWFTGRIDRREATIEAGADRLDRGTQLLIENLTKRLDDVTSRLGIVEHELAECRSKHSEAEAKVIRLEATIQGLGDARQQAANIVAAERAMDRTVKAINAAAEGNAQ